MVEVSVSGISGSGINASIGRNSLYEGSVDSILSGWTRIIQQTRWREKVQFLRDNGALIRYEVDNKEGPHAHYENNGFKIKIHIPQSYKMTME